MFNGHNLMIYVMPIFKALGYEENEIKSIEFFGNQYPAPDYIINSKGEKIAVEVGSLSSKTKIQDLLKEFDRVIWINSDRDFPMLNVITFNKNEIQTIKSRNESIIDYENRIKEMQNIIDFKNKYNEELQYKLNFYENGIFELRRTIENIEQHDFNKDNMHQSITERFKDILIDEVPKQRKIHI